MCDMLMLSFWIWALVFYERALQNESSRWQFVMAGTFAGLAVLSKYSAVLLLPLMAFWGITRTQKLGWWLLSWLRQYSSLRVMKS
jgi:4-amino-4-deoxy-L-arabinose transferase-like glycosyltransferase